MIQLCFLSFSPKKLISIDFPPSKNRFLPKIPGFLFTRNPGIKDFHQKIDFHRFSTPKNRFLPKIPGFLVTRNPGIKDFDFSSGYEYWNKTKDYWQDVRTIWSQILGDEDYFKLKKKVDGKPLYMYHFSQAANPEIINLPSEERKQVIKRLLDKFVIR